MRKPRTMSVRQATRKGRIRSRRPEAESLEGRILLYSTIGHWTYSSRITYSFMPDGTNIAGTPSVLFQTLNAIAPRATWENQIEQAATPWEANANLNLAQVPDNGAAFGSSGNQQDDPNFGDIRIGAMPLPSGILAETFLPPPSNGGTAAGDIVFNSTVAWRIGGGYDLETVAAHEFGHALGLGDQSSDIYGVMYYSFDGIKTALDSDDISGIQSLYGAPQYDRFNPGGSKNFTPFAATNITPYIDGNGQIALSGLDNTTPTQSEYYVVTVPATNSGQMVVTLQSSNLSSFAPGLYVLNTSMRFVAQASAPSTYGATLVDTVAVTAGQKYYIKVASSGTYGRVGAYGLEVNFGTQSQPPIDPPYTVVPDQPDGGGGSTNALVAGGGHGGSGASSPGLAWAAMGGDSGWVDRYTTSAFGIAPGADGATIATTTLPTESANGGAGTVASITPVSVVAGPAATPVATSPSVVSLVAPLPAQGPAAAPAPSRPRLVHHAVDASLPGWKGHRRRPLGGAKVRAALAEHASLA